jgi:hypothetical protein
MKFAINTVTFILLTLSACSARPDGDIIDLLKREKFQFEIFELSMCAEEILSILQSDTAYHKMWEKRIQRANDSRLSEYDRYMHSAEYSFFLQQCHAFDSQYKRAVTFVKQSSSSFQMKTYADLSLPFNNYVHYPEDIDPASLIVLICLPEKALDDISKNKTSRVRFNNWIEYGYKEFRYGFTKNNVAKKKINDRMIDFIITKHSKSTHHLALASITMLKKIEY